MRLATGVTLVLLALLTACAPRGPVLGSGQRLEGVGGTISGSVRAASDKMGLSGRTVTAVNIATGQRIQTSTADNGGYTMKVPVGRYRLEVELRPGEALSEQPADLEINRSDVDAQRNFLVTMKAGLH
jgi:Carboxypeptidase regulatory-like domain